MLFQNSRVVSLVSAGPPLTPLPFLADPKEYADRWDAPLLESSDVSKERLKDLASEVDVGVSLGCRRILRKEELSAPRYGTFNLHPSALPKYRGMHPDLYAIMDGQTSVGITLHRMDTGIDTGPIVAQATEEVCPDDTIVSLTDKLYSRGAGLLEELLVELASEAPVVSEVRQVRSFDQLEPRRDIDWRDSGWRIHNLVRALTYPWPMARTRYGGQELLVSAVRVVEDGRINPGRIHAASGDGIRVGTGGNSVDILELRDEQRNVLPLDKLIAELGLVPGESCLGSVVVHPVR